MGTAAFSSSFKIEESSTCLLEEVAVSLTLLTPSLRHKRNWTQLALRQFRRTRRQSLFDLKVFRQTHQNWKIVRSHFFTNSYVNQCAIS